MVKSPLNRPRKAAPREAHRVIPHSWNEWDPLREVVVGVIDNARIPSVRDLSSRCIDFPLIPEEELSNYPAGAYPRQVIEETKEDLEDFADLLKASGITVHRPPTQNYSDTFATEAWEVDGYYGYCPRDSVLIVGKKAIETPMTMRHRQKEAEQLFGNLFPRVQAPRPALPDSSYIWPKGTNELPALANDEPIFDAANCIRCGNDLFYLVSNSGNYAGGFWLQQELLEDGVRVHLMNKVYDDVHVDTTILPLRPGLVLLNPERVNDDNLPSYFRNWEKLYCPEPNAGEFYPEWAPASKWIAMNVLSIDPDTVMVEASQTRLIKALENKGLTVVPTPLRHARTLSGGPHCVTLDLIRNGGRGDYS